MQSPNILNGTPPCQNIMFPPLSLYNYYKENYENYENNYNKYQPVINIPTRTSTATIGEVGASVELVRAHVLELSKRMESIENRFSEFEKRASSDILLLKNTLLEHSTEILKMGESVDNTLAHVKSTNDLIEHQEECIDKLADAYYEHDRLYKKRRQQQQNGIRTTASSIDLGMIRRRLSKVEDFTSEFYEQFENFKNVKDIFSSLSDHIDECDRDISSVVTKNIENIENQNNQIQNNNIQNNQIQNNQIQVDIVSSTYAMTDLDNYFSKYNDDENNDDDDFEKL
jgi:hypothetical protein